MSIRVLLADDQQLVRAGFRMVLKSEPDFEVVGEASDGLQAVSAAGRLKPDVVLMDIRMPNLDGLEATERIVEREGPRVLVLPPSIWTSTSTGRCVPAQAASCSRTRRRSSSWRRSGSSPMAVPSSPRRSRAG